MADRPNAAASVWTIEPDEIPSTDHRPAARPCATLRVDDVQRVLARRDVEQQAADDEQPEVLSPEHHASCTNPFHVRM